MTAREAAARLREALEEHRRRVTEARGFIDFDRRTRIADVWLGDVAAADLPALLAEVERLREENKDLIETIRCSLHDACTTECMQVARES